MAKHLARDTYVSSLMNLCNFVNLCITYNREKNIKILNIYLN